MVRLIRLTANLPLWVGAICLFAMMLLTFLDVVLRSVANAPITGAAELTEVLLAAVVFLALPVASFDDRHISVDLVDAALGERAIRVRDAFINILFGVLLFWPVTACWEGAMRTVGYGEVTLYLRLPVGIIAAGITLGLAAGAAAMILRGLLLALRPAELGRRHDAGFEA